MPGAWSSPPVSSTPGEWTPEKMRRLRALVERAHANGLWIRFYTLDGATKMSSAVMAGFTAITSETSLPLANDGRPPWPQV